MNAQLQPAAYTSPTEKLKAWVDGAVLHLSFNNVAKHNAISVDMWEAVPILLDQAEKDDAIRMVVFSGQGPKAFASGADISQFEDMRAAREAVKKYEHMAENALMGLYRFSKPVVAAIRGYCIGGGLNMAISCDIRIATSDSVFSIPATRLGLGCRCDRQNGDEKSGRARSETNARCPRHHSSIHARAAPEGRGVAMPGRLMRSRNSSRVRALSRKMPIIALVTANEFCFSTPRIDMHRCVPSQTTATPIGSIFSRIVSAI